MHVHPLDDLEENSRSLKHYRQTHIGNCIGKYLWESMPLVSFYKKECALSIIQYLSSPVITYLLTYWLIYLLTYLLSSGQEVLGLASAEMPYTLVACAYLVDGGTYSHNQKWSYIIALRASIDRVSTWTDQENTPADYYGDRSRAWNQSRWHIAAGHHKIFADWTQCAQMKYYKHTILSEQICQCELQLRLI